MTDEEVFPRTPFVGLALLALTGVAAFLSYLILQPFIAPIAWAVALAIAARPVHCRLERRMRPSAAAGLTAVLVAVAVIAPALFAGDRLVRQAVPAFQRLGEHVRSGDWVATVQQVPWLGEVAQWIERADLAGVAESVASFIARNMPALLSGSAWVVVDIVLTVFFLFFFLRDAEYLLGGLRSMIPLSNGETTAC